jgi:hypothetical protein
VKTLAFEPGGRIRRARFELRSCLPVSAACVVASGMRETLSSLLGAPVVVRLFEPAIPQPDAWPAIADDALLYRVRGGASDAALILRRSDAAALASALFGELQATGRRPLSPLERDVLDRTARALAANLAAVCGARDGNGVETLSGVKGFVTYFELQLEEPIAARIGVALSRDPRPEPRGRIEIGQLANVEIEGSACLDIGEVAAAAVARLAPGAELPLSPATLSRATLHSAGVRLARGICGVRNRRYAMFLEMPRGRA